MSANIGGSMYRGCAAEKSLEGTKPNSPYLKWLKVLPLILRGSYL